MRVLLSIKPEFAEKILNGAKRYEFRKQAFAQPVEAVVLYATKPVGKIVRLAGTNLAANGTLCRHK